MSTPNRTVRKSAAITGTANKVRTAAGQATTKPGGHITRITSGQATTKPGGRITGTASGQATTKPGGRIAKPAVGAHLNGKVNKPVYEVPKPVKRRAVKK